MKEMTEKKLKQKKEREKPRPRGNGVSQTMMMMKMPRDACRCKCNARCRPSIRPSVRPDPFVPPTQSCFPACPCRPYAAANEISPTQTRESRVNRPNADDQIRPAESREGQPVECEERERRKEVLSSRCRMSRPSAQSTRAKPPPGRFPNHFSPSEMSSSAVLFCSCSLAARRTPSMFMSRIA
jgi:hypothetical protein